MTPDEAAKHLALTIPADDAPPAHVGRHVADWDDLRRGRVRLDRTLLAAAADLARADVPLLVSTLAGRHRPSVATIMAFLASEWSDELGEQWLSAAATRSMRALAVQTWVRQLAMTATSRLEVSERLERVRQALAMYAADDEAPLWWELLSIAPRLEQRRLGVDFILCLYEVAAHVIAAKQLLPSAEELLAYKSSNSCVTAVLPYVVQLGDQAFATRCAEVFRQTISTLITVKDEYLATGSTCADLHLESCGVAIAQAQDAGWWVPVVEEAVGKHLRWNDEPSYEHLQKAVWLLTAACVGVVIEHRDNKRTRLDLIEMLESVMLPNLARLFWEAEDRQRVLLAELLCTALALDPANGPGHIARLAREVRSPKLLCGVLKRGGAVLSADVLAELIALLRQRMSFYEALKEDDSDD